MLNIQLMGSFALKPEGEKDININKNAEILLSLFILARFLDSAQVANDQTKRTWNIRKKWMVETLYEVTDPQDDGKSIDNYRKMAADNYRKMAAEAFQQQKVIEFLREHGLQISSYTHQTGKLTVDPSNVTIDVLELAEAYQADNWNQTIKLFRWPLLGDWTEKWQKQEWFINIQEMLASWYVVACMELAGSERNKMIAYKEELIKMRSPSLPSKLEPETITIKEQIERIENLEKMAYQHERTYADHLTEAVDKCSDLCRYLHDGTRRSPPSRVVQACNQAREQLPLSRNFIKKLPKCFAVGSLGEGTSGLHPEKQVIILPTGPRSDGSISEIPPGWPREPKCDMTSSEIEKQWQKLDEPERIFLRRLSVFKGGCDLTAAQEICAHGPVVIPSYYSDLPTDLARLHKADVVKFLTNLVAKKIVSDRESRYFIKEAYQPCAHTHLASSRELEVLGTCHRDYFLAVACADEQANAEKLKVERYNLIAALEYCTAASNRTDAGNCTDVEKGLQLVVALEKLWNTGKHGWLEAKEAIEESIELALQKKTPKSSSLLRKALLATARVALCHDAFDAVNNCLGKCSMLITDIDDEEQRPDANERDRIYGYLFLKTGYDTAKKTLQNGRNEVVNILLRNEVVNILLSWGDAQQGIGGVPERDAHTEDNVNELPAPNPSEFPAIETD